MRHATKERPAVSVFYRTLRRGAPPEPLHTHRHEVSIRVLEGVVYLVSEDDERAMTPGDMATIRAGSWHRVSNAGDGDAHLLEG